MATGFDIGQPPGQQFYCKLIIGDNEFSSQNINSLIIREWIFNILPTIEIYFTDDGFLTETFPLEDNQLIQIIIGKNAEDANQTELLFDMSDYQVQILGDNRKQIVMITGFLHVDDFYLAKHRCFGKKNSADVLAKIADEAGYAFSNPRNIIPNDNMTWYQANISNQDFIKHVLKRAYIPNDAAIAYISLQNEFVYTSLNKEISKYEFTNANYNVTMATNDIQDQNDDTIWYSSYDVLNYSGYFNKTIAYGIRSEYYDLQDFISNDYSTIKKLTDLSFRDKNLVGDGKFVLHTLGGDIISRNIYNKKYFESMLRNKMLIDNFFANSVLINANALNDIRLMDKINLSIPSLIDSTPNTVMSGYYLVGGIVHHIAKGSIYRKLVSLSRNGMNSSGNVENPGVE